MKLVMFQLPPDVFVCAGNLCIGARMSKGPVSFGLASTSNHHNRLHLMDNEVDAVIQIMLQHALTLVYIPYSGCAYVCIIMRQASRLLASPSGSAIILCIVVLGSPSLHSLVAHVEQLSSSQSSRFWQHVHREYGYTTADE